MKLIAFFLVIFLTYTKLFCQQISGYVLDSDTKKPLLGAKVFLTDYKKTNDDSNFCAWSVYAFKIVQETKTDSFGRFKFSNIINGKYNVIAKFLMPPLEKYEGITLYREDIDSNIVVNKLSKHRKTFKLLVTCPFDKTSNQLFCPRCMKKDKVLIIRYGLPIVDSIGNELGGSNYHWGSCFRDLYCNASKYCKRCKLEF